MKIIALHENLFDLMNFYKIDGIMNAANGIGVMGVGIAGAIRKHGGFKVQTDAFRVCEELDPKEGEAYVTTSGKLIDRGIKKIIHAVVMKNPGSPTSYEIVEAAFKSALDLAYEQGIEMLGCTALGTGVGRLDVSKVAKIMVDVAFEHSKIDLVFADFSVRFIQDVQFFELEHLTKKDC
jgi:O-acetyl-ADP-ribose deacetylase